MGRGNPAHFFCMQSPRNKNLIRIEHAHRDDGVPARLAGNPHRLEEIA
jgi:hypothetical protein